MAPETDLVSRARHFGQRAVRSARRRMAAFYMKTGSLNPRQHQPQLSTPGGYSKAQILDAFLSIAIDGSSQGELAPYASEDCERFLHTLALTPENAQHCLEIGASPYFTTLLFKWFRPNMRLTLTNYFNGGVEEQAQHVEIRNPNGANEAHGMRYLNINFEQDTMPAPDGSFDVILFCEVLEHMTNDPMKALLEIWRLLAPGGRLILTTPNVARLENVARMASGLNMYDPYSGYGPYGRHNREYTRHELWKLMTQCGFEGEIMFTADVSENRAAHYFHNIGALVPLVKHRAVDLGQYHFTAWTKAGPPNPLKPTWLYRSLPEADLDFRSLNG